MEYELSHEHKKWNRKQLPLVSFKTKKAFLKICF